MMSADSSYPILIFPTLREYKKRFEQWCGAQTKRSGIPEELWEAAVEVARDYGINKTAHAVRLNCTKPS